MPSFWTLPGSDALLVDANGKLFWCDGCPCGEESVCPNFPASLRLNLSNIFPNDGYDRCNTYTNPCNNSPPESTDGLEHAYGPVDQAYSCGGWWGVANDSKYYRKPLYSFCNGDFVLPKTLPAEIGPGTEDVVYGKLLGVLTYKFCTSEESTVKLGVSAHLHGPCETPDEDYQINAYVRIGIWNGEQALEDLYSKFSRWSTDIDIPAGVAWLPYIQNLTVDPSPTPIDFNVTGAAGDMFGDYSWDWSVRKITSGNDSGTPNVIGGYTDPKPIMPPLPGGYGVAVIGY